MKIVNVHDLTFDPIRLGKFYYLLYDYDNCCVKEHRKNEVELHLYLEHRKKYKYKMTFMERNTWHRRNKEIYF